MAVQATYYNKMAAIKSGRGEGNKPKQLIWRAGERFLQR